VRNKRPERLKDALKEVEVLATILPVNYVKSLAFAEVLRIMPV
jgi:hypothetical protein